MTLKKKEPIKKRDRAASEKAVIKAATGLFALKGFDGTRTLEIAQKAGVNEALITRYFGGKEGLLASVLEESREQRASSAVEMCTMDESTRWIPEYDSSQNFEETLKLFFNSGHQHFNQKESLIRITLSQSLVDPKMSRVLREKTLEHSIPILQTLLRKHLGKKISSSDLESLSLLLMATNFAINFMGRMVHEVEQKKLDRVVDLLIDALVAKME